MNVEEYTEYLVKSICSNPDLVKVKCFETEESKVIEIVASKEDMGLVIGKNGNTIQAIKTLINAYSYLHGLGKIEINVNSI